jgi:hypothetical protein
MKNIISILFLSTKILFTYTKLWVTEIQLWWLRKQCNNQQTDCLEDPWSSQ